MVNKKINHNIEGLNTTKFELINKIINKNYIKYQIDFK